MPACHGAALRVQRQHPRPLCRRRTPSAWLRPAAQAQPGEGLHSAAGRQVRRRLVLRAPVPRGRRLLALGRRVCAMAQAARLEPAPALHVGAGSIDSGSTLQRMLPKEFILILSK